jgi:hypothetical protein
MKLVQRHLIKFNKNEFLAFDKLAFLSKNLYNCAVYLGFAAKSFSVVVGVRSLRVSSRSFQALLPWFFVPSDVLQEG